MNGASGRVIRIVSGRRPTAYFLWMAPRAMPGPVAWDEKVHSLGLIRGASGQSSGQRMARTGHLSKVDKDLTERNVLISKDSTNRQAT